MNFNTFNSIKDDKNLKVNEKYFYMLIVNYAASKGFAYPSYEQLKKDLNTTRRDTISDLIKSLVKKGYISYNKGNSIKKSNEYYPLKYITSSNNETSTEIEPSTKNDTSPKIETSKSTENETSASTESETPNKQTNKCTNKNKYNAFEVKKQVEELWDLYPRKVGKSIAIKKIPKLISQYGFEQIKSAIDRYVRTKEEWRQWKDGSTFFNVGYLDYLNGNDLLENEEDEGDPLAGLKKF